ncbi:MAG TPA: histidine kinase [Bryobacteraceae bacterium]|nr:histidine kinase [Bryobacteraceae bacterium]
MHPILMSRARLAFYLLAWVPLAGAAAVFLKEARQTWTYSLATAAGLALFYALVCLSPWYTGRYLPLQPAGFGKLLVNHTAAAVVAAALLLGLASLLGVPEAQRVLLFVSGVLLYLLAAALHYVLFSFQNTREAEIRMQAARVQTREAELKALKAQINPHFLFNSLNSISALATADPERAREMCLRLAEFLRATLNLAEEEIIPVEQELTLARTYLEVEQVRFGDRLKFAESVAPGCAACTVPSLILQPLVENAVKHGIAGLVEGGEIHLGADCRDGMLRITVDNDYDPDSAGNGRNGVGLANVRDRLKTIYQKEARISTQTGDRRYSVTLEFPCQ